MLSFWADKRIKKKVEKKKKGSKYYLEGYGPSDRVAARSIR